MTMADKAKKVSKPKSVAKKSAKPFATKSSKPAPSVFGVGVWPTAGFTAPTTPKSMESIMSKSQNQFGAMSQDANVIVKDSVEAFVKSGKIAAERVQDIMSTCMSMAQDASEKQASAIKNLMACKTINEVTDCQSKMAQQSFDEIMSAMTKVTELSIKLATEAMEPINDQVSKSIKKATDSIAA
jgi:phasin family protein